MPEPSTTALVGIGTLVTGSLERPVDEHDALLVQDGRIAAIGASSDFSGAERVIDVGGATVGPVLIDSHCHVVLGDYTPRQQTVGFLASYVHGGICQAISPGEIHTPGRPRDAAGVKALAVLARRSWSQYRPGGMKVHGGAIVIEPTLSPEDFEEVAAQGVFLAKYGFGAFEDPLDGELQIRAAQAAGIKVMCHSGGASIPGSKPITAETLLALRPDVCGHVNGGPTSLSDDGVRTIVDETDMMLQLVQAGNLGGGGGGGRRARGGRPPPPRAGGGPPTHPPPPRTGLAGRCARHHRLGVGVGRHRGLLRAGVRPGRGRPPRRPGGLRCAVGLDGRRRAGRPGARRHTGDLCGPDRRRGSCPAFSQHTRRRPACGSDARDGRACRLGTRMRTRRNG